MRKIVHCSKVNVVLTAHFINSSTSKHTMYDQKMLNYINQYIVQTIPTGQTFILCESVAHQS